MKCKDIIQICLFSNLARALSARELHQSPLQNNKMHGCSNVKKRHSFNFTTNNFVTSFRFASSGTSSNKSLMYKVHIIDANGKSSQESQLMSYSDILKDSSIHVRDLFSLSLTAVDEEGKDKKRNTLTGKRTSRYRATPVILPRGEKIVISFGHIRAIVGYESGMIFDAHDPNVNLFAKDLTAVFEERSKEKSEYCHDHNDPRSKQKECDPFEIIFLEEVLKEACSTWNRRILIYEPIVNAFISKVSDELYSQSGVHRLVPIKDSLQNFELQVQQGLECLTDLLKNDEDMVGLLLTEQENNKQIYGKSSTIDIHRHVSVELLLEEYYRQLHHLLQDIQYLIRRVDSQQFLVTISLDTFRNRLIRTNLYMSVVAVALASATTIAGFFGMNLISGLEDSPTAFLTVCSLSTLLGIGMTSGYSWYLSESRLRILTASKYKEIELIKCSLNNENGIDYLVKTLQQRADDEQLSVDYFYELLKEPGIYDKGMNKKQIEFLFEMLDSSKDGKFCLHDDLPALKNDKLFK